MQGIDQIVKAVAEHHFVPPPRGPCRRGVGWGQRLRITVRIYRCVLALQRREIFPDGALRLLFVGPVYRCSFDALEATIVGVLYTFARRCGSRGR